RVTEVGCCIATCASFTAPAVGQTAFSDPTPCALAVHTLESKDGAKIRDLVVLIRHTMDKLDSIHTQNGEPGIMASLSNDGFLDLSAMVTVHCRLHPQQLLFDSIAIVYRGTRDFEMEFGTAH